MRAQVALWIIASMIGASGDAAPPAFRKIVAEHNRHRAKHCAPPLQWSKELAKVAQGWADTLRKKGCVLEHSKNAYGENMAAGTIGLLDPERLVAGWYDEVKIYDFEKPVFSMEAGHFTQLVWAKTTRIGCGTTQCNGLDIWVCNYDPPGNIHGKFKENVKPKSCK